MFTSNPYALGGWHNPHNPHSINDNPWCSNALYSPTFGALPMTQTSPPSTLTFEFSTFQPDILNSVVTGPKNLEFFTIRTQTPDHTVIYKARVPFAIITWQQHPIVEANAILSPQQTGDFIKIAADQSHRSMIINGKRYAWIPRRAGIYLFSTGPNPPVQFARTSFSNDHRKVILEIATEAFQAGLFETCIISTVLLFCARSID